MKGHLRKPRTEDTRVSVTAIITEQINRKYRSIITLSNGDIREGLGSNAAIAEQNALNGLQLDWSDIFPASLRLR